MLLLFVEKVRASPSVILRRTILGLIILRLALELPAREIANNEAHGHANETDTTYGDKNDSNRRCILFDALDDLMLAISIDGDSVSNVREKVVATISTEACALPISLQDLENWVVFGTLGAVHNAIEVWTLVKSCGTELICHHFLLHLRGKDTRIGIAGALIGTEHLLPGQKDLVKLVDHAALQTASIVELL